MKILFLFFIFFIPLIPACEAPVGTHSDAQSKESADSEEAEGVEPPVWIDGTYLTCQSGAQTGAETEVTCAIKDKTSDQIVINIPNSLIVRISVLETDNVFARNEQTGLYKTKLPTDQIASAKVVYEVTRKGQDFDKSARVIVPITSGEVGQDQPLQPANSDQNPQEDPQTDDSPPTLSLTFSDGRYYIPRTASSPDGQRFVVSSGISGIQGGGIDKVVAVFFNQDLSVVNTVDLDQEACTSSGAVTRPLALNNNRFVVLWHQECGNNLKFRIFDKDGNAVSQVISVLTGVSHIDHHIAKYNDGENFVIAYRQIASPETIRFRYFNASGGAVGIEETFVMPDTANTSFHGFVTGNGTWPVAAIYSTTTATQRLLPPGLGGPQTNQIFDHYINNTHDTDLLVTSHDNSRIFIIDEPIGGAIAVFDADFNGQGQVSFPTVDSRSWPGVFPVAREGYTKSALHSVSLRSGPATEAMPGRRVVDVSGDAGTGGMFISTSSLPSASNLHNLKVTGGSEKAVITAVDTSKENALVIIMQDYEQ